MAAEQLKKEKNHPIMAAGLTFFSLPPLSTILLPSAPSLTSKEVKKSRGIFATSNCLGSFSSRRKSGESGNWAKNGGRRGGIHRSQNSSPLPCLPVLLTATKPPIFFPFCSFFPPVIASPRFHRALMVFPPPPATESV